MRKLVLTAAMLAGTTLVLLPACSTSPSAPTVSFTSPVASQPSAGAGFKFKDQPVTLTITNAVRTGQATTTYSVEIATDAGFANKVYTKDSIPEGSGTTTSLTVGNLGGGATYYWHWKAVVDGVTGTPSTTQTFTIAQQVVLNPPALSAPANGAVSNNDKPAFTITNSTRSGQPGTIFYEFQVSTSSSFSPVLASATVQEQPTSTTWTPTTSLPASNLFWRARATSPSDSEVSGYANAAAFSVQPFNPKAAIYLDNPGDVGDWPEAGHITSIDFNPDALMVDFDRRTGPGAWIEAGFGDGGIQYTLGMCFNLSNQWYCSAAIQFWTGRDLEAAGSPYAIPQNWYYNPARWGPMAGYQPQNGELVAIWAGHGNLRQSGNTYRERTDFVLVKYGDSYRRP